MKLRLSTLRWPLTAATAGVAVLWVGSMFARVWWTGGFWGVFVSAGGVSIAHDERLLWVTQTTNGLQVGGSSVEWNGWVGWSNIQAWPVCKRRGSSPIWVGIPFWMPLVVTGVFTSRAWRSHRARTTAAHRARTGACPRCGYAREGLAPAAPCPECALVPPPPPPSTAPPVPPATPS